MNQDKMLEYLQKHYPNVKVKLIGSGWSSDAFEAGDKIIRIPKTDVKPYEKEIAILEFLQNKLPVQIPRPRLLKGEIPYAEHTKIEGLNWSIKTYKKLSEKEQDLFAKDIAHFFAVLHAIPAKEILKAISPELITPTKLDPVKKFYDYLKSDFSKKDIKIVYDWCKKHSQTPNKPVLLHTDFWEANCLVNKQHRLTGVFDWANAFMGNPEYEFLTLYYPEYTPLLDKVLKFYNKETGRNISKDSFEKLKLSGCLGLVQYFGQNPKLKTTMAKQWGTTLSAVKDTLTAIQAENLNLNKQNIKKIER